MINMNRKELKVLLRVIWLYKHVYGQLENARMIQKHTCAIHFLIQYQKIQIFFKTLERTDRLLEIIIKIFFVRKIFHARFFGVTYRTIYYVYFYYKRKLQVQLLNILQNVFYKKIRIFPHNIDLHKTYYRYIPSNHMITTLFLLETSQMQT